LNWHVINSVLYFQDLLGILRCYPIQPAILPLLLVIPPEIEEGDETEPEPVEDLETEELMRTYSSKFAASGRYRWRRSRWLRNCPVALADGDIVPGKTEFTVAYVTLNVVFCH
jgi:adenylate/nucleoside-diphosphate kinase